MPTRHRTLLEELRYFKLRHKVDQDFQLWQEGSHPKQIQNEEMMRQMYTMMPDLHLTIEDLIAEDDKVVCKNHWRWTDAQTGKKMGFHGFVLWRFDGDKIAERWATVTKPAEDSSWE